MEKGGSVALYGSICIAWFVYRVGRTKIVEFFELVCTNPIYCRMFISSVLHTLICILRRHHCCDSSLSTIFSALQSMISIGFES